MPVVDDSHQKYSLTHNHGELMMRQRCFFSASLSAVLFLITISGSVVADLSTQLIVDEFNSMNDDQGYLFRTSIIQTGSSAFYGPGSGEIRLLNNADPLAGQVPNLSAYQMGLTANNSPNAGLYFQTFCIAPERTLEINDHLAGQLNYESNRTATHNGKALPWGVAWLYKEFAAGTLAGYSYDNTDPVNNRVNSAVLLQDAIWFLMGDTAYLIDSGTNWTNNIFLQHLNAIPGYSQAFWHSAYNPETNYDFMDDYKVFAMNVSIVPNSPANVRQDVLYAIRYNGDLVPEPASLLFWVLGSLGVAGVACRKRRINTGA